MTFQFRTIRRILLAFLVGCVNYRGLKSEGFFSSSAKFLVLILFVQLPVPFPRVARHLPHFPHP